MRLVLFLFCLLTWSDFASAQREEVIARVTEYCAKVPQEKVYVHTDKAYYAAGDTIWYRAHLVDAVTNKPVSRSRFVNIELYDRSADTLVNRQIVKCDSDGVFANAIMIDKRQHSGQYTLVAYTQWMRNFDADNFYYKPLLILGSDKLEAASITPSATQEIIPSAAQGDATRPVTSVGEAENSSMPFLNIYQRGNYIYIPTPAESTEDDLCVVSGGGQMMTFTPQRGKVNRIDASPLGSGSIHVALVRSNPLTVIAEQTFQMKETDSPTVSISSKATTDAKSPMTVDFRVTNADGSPLKAICSVSVTDYNVVKPDTIQPDIKEYLRYTSEKAPSGHALQNMLTGNYPTIEYGFQTNQTITGNIRGTWRKHLKNPKLLFVNTRLGQQFEFELGDSSRFSVIVDNPENSTFVLQGTRKNGSTMFVELDVDPQTFPQPHLPQLSGRLMGMEEAGKFVTQAHEQQTYSAIGTIELPEVVKKSKAKRKNYARMEAPRGLQEGDSRIENAVSMRALLHTLGIYTEYIDGEERFRRWQVGKCYIDNFLETDNLNILNIVPSDVKSIEYFTPNDPQNSLFGVRADESGRVPGVLFIFLKDGSEYLRNTTSKDLLSMAKVQQLGYRYPRAFWSPQYPDADKSQYTRPDHRTTLYWNPKVTTDENGHAKLTFYSSDVSKQYLITIEGVADDGTIISRQEVIE